MGVRWTEAAVAAGFGAADTLLASKVKGTAPGGIPWPVALRGGGILFGMFGDKLGASAEITDPILFASITLGAAGVTRGALAGKLMTGPAAWGGVVGSDPSYATSALGVGGDDALPAGGAGARSVRLLAGRKTAAGVGGASVYPAMAEAPGVAG